MATTCAQAQEQYATFKVSLAYQTHYENIVPAPLTVLPTLSRILQNSSAQVYYSPAEDEIDYSVSSQLTAQVIFRGDGGIEIDCHLRLERAHRGIYIGDFIYYPSLGQIQAVLAPDGGPLPIKLVEVAYLLYVDEWSPGNYTYHFRGNDALFALAQQMFGVSFTGVTLKVDVEAPSS